MEKLNEVIDFYEMTGDEPELLVMLLELRRHRLDNWKQRAEAAEAHATEGWRVAHEVGAECDQLNARLAELTRRPPVGNFYEDGPGNWWQIGPHDKVPHVTPLFDRPAPAADLAELVPDAKAIRKEAGGYAPVYSLQEQQLFIDGATWLRAAILHSIELANGSAN